MTERPLFERPKYPILELDLKTTEGRRRCYDEFCLYCLKRHQFEQFVGARSAWLNEKAKKNLFLMHLSLPVYEAIRESYFGQQDNPAMSNLELNEMLDEQSVDQLFKNLGSYLQSIQENA